MSYHGDIRLGDTIDIKFTTRAFATGVPTTLAGSPAVAAYVGNSTTEITAGITLSVDFDSRTGLNNIRVVATSGNGYATATNIELVITAGTVGGTSVVGEVVASFSIENRSALMPTVAAKTLDVSTAGNAGIDWSNIEAPTTAQGLTGTTISTSQVVASVSGAVGSVTGAVGSVTGNVGGNVVGSVASVTGNVGGSIVGNILGGVVGDIGGDVLGDVLGGVQGTIDAISVAANAEPGQGAPPAAPTFLQMAQYLYKAWRNKTTQTATQYSLFADDESTVDQKATFSDNGTTATRGEVVTGP